MTKFLVSLIALVFIGLAIAIAHGFVAPLKVHYRHDVYGPPTGPARTDSGNPNFVGLALSGGGARAAVFAAAGMQALHERGLLSTVTDVSSVSGGGFAASYLALHPVPEEGPADIYFDQMIDVVAHNYFREVQLLQLQKPSRAFSPSRRLISLQEALDRPGFLGKARFADLPHDRNFYFNAVSYDTGQRVVLSNGTLPAPESAETTSVLPSRLRALSFAQPDRPASTPDDFPVSLAVATSAAFPPYLGPTTVELDYPDQKTPRYLHLGDGGVFENTGAETLREAIYARGPKQDATLYIFNAGMQLDPDLSQNTLDISIWSRDVTRLVDVLTEYAGAHRKTMYEELDAKFSMNVVEHEFNYMDIVALSAAGKAPNPRWLSWESWKNATQADRNVSATPAEHLAKVPTALKISPLNKDLMAAAAADLVELRFPVMSLSE